jgi:DNA invertase Pin-like site-specific DNA recombinase
MHLLDVKRFSHFGLKSSVQFVKRLSSCARLTSASEVSRPFRRGQLALAMTAVVPIENSELGRKIVRAAQYVRMSTEHQKYSTENQAEIIGVYAAARGIEIVRTYADEGKSGLNINGREALQELISDVTSGRADYSVVLVYDISRWGRFQDADQGAYYEVTCRRAGVAVHYCAEQFENDGSISSTIIKTVKRAMAGEYSRELSAKVFTGQCRLIRYGFRQGGPAGFGLRRVLVDENRNLKAELARGEHKSLQTDRVILRPGPPDEIETVRRVYRLFTLQGLSERRIAELLNGEGLKTDHDRPWTRGTVHQVLTNEKYIGNNVFNRVSFKLKAARVANPLALDVGVFGRDFRLWPHAMSKARHNAIKTRWLEPDVRAQQLTGMRVDHSGKPRTSHRVEKLLVHDAQIDGRVVHDRDLEDMVGFHGALDGHEPIQRQKPSHRPLGRFGA